MRPRRTLLFMPGDSLRKIEKGTGLAVDSIIMDLEDGVAFSQKEAARKTIVEAIKTFNFGNRETLVRLNTADSELIAQDIAETLPAAPDGYVIPKVESLDHLQQVDALIHQYGGDAIEIPLFAIIESALGVVNLREIATYSGLKALMFGAEDLAGSLGAQRTPAMQEVTMARQAVVTHAKAFGLQAIDTPYVDIHNLEGLKTESETARQWGYDGKLCIHPKHIDIINTAFTPEAAAIEAAKKLIEAYALHQQSGMGAFVYDGKMVDSPMIRAAENVLSRAGDANG